MAHIDTDHKFEFQLAGSNEVAIIIFAGDMNSRGISELDRCKSAIEGLTNPKRIIFYFKDVSTVSGDAITYLARLQALVRSKNIDLHLCCLSPPIREKLLRMGILRHKETSDNLAQALKLAA